ncbi:FUSC family protein [Microbacterium telephonicum]|uniref:Aromatic acid exporter family member 1 n=1 Tax=Microbacterium telephonicum TaxID=1714841 RepID=A0A498BZC4_9MICO|nr:FUSC family protein [Microbacterium telephonicum]RLK47666.1 hypothetical protein C7474_2263 [Microbacterium telephonicum]
MSAAAAASRRRRATAALAAAGSPPRLLLAAKTAVAAVIAWYLAPLIPFAQDEYSYYAPLGVLVTMYPTVARTARAGGEALLGLGLGIVVGLGGLALVYAGVRGGVALALVVLVGVLAGGVRALGVGSDWVALAGLFVLLLGGGKADDFSISYLVTMAFGVAVGLVVNLVVFPPLYVRRARVRLNALRDAVAEQLRALAAAVADGDVDPERIEADMSGLAATMDAVETEVREAAESSRVNPRGRRHREEINENDARMQGIAAAWRATRELADTVCRLKEEADPWLDAEVREGLARAIADAAELLAAPVGADDAVERLEAASASLDRLRRVPGLRPDAESAVAERFATVLFLQRIVDACRVFV